MKWSNLWRHYSSYALYAVITIGSLEQYMPQLKDNIPPWALITVGLCGAIVKIIPQDPPKTNAPENVQ